MGVRRVVLRGLRIKGRPRPGLLGRRATGSHEHASRIPKCQRQSGSPRPCGRSVLQQGQRIVPLVTGTPEATKQDAPGEGGTRARAGEG